MFKSIARGTSRRQLNILRNILALSFKGYSQWSCASIVSGPPGIPHIVEGTRDGGSFYFMAARKE